MRPELRLGLNHNTVRVEVNVGTWAICQGLLYTSATRHQEWCDNPTEEQRFLISIPSVSGKRVGCATESLDKNYNIPVTDQYCEGNLIDEQ